MHSANHGNPWQNYCININSFIISFSAQGVGVGGLHSYKFSVDFYGVVDDKVCAFWSRGQPHKGIFQNSSGSWKDDYGYFWFTLAVITEKKNCVTSDWLNRFKFVSNFQKSTYRVLDRNVEINLAKADKSDPWPRLTYNKQKPVWLRLDFDKWKLDDSEEEEEEEEQQQQQVRNLSKRNHVFPFICLSHSFLHSAQFLFLLCHPVCLYFFLLSLSLPSSFLSPRLLSSLFLLPPLQSVFLSISLSICRTTCLSVSSIFLPLSFISSPTPPCLACWLNRIYIMLLTLTP